MKLLFWMNELGNINLNIIYAIQSRRNNQIYSDSRVQLFKSSQQVNSRPI